MDQGLRWPPGVPRSPRQWRSRFSTSLGAAVREVLDELALAKRRNVTITCNVPGHVKDGVWRPYANARVPIDMGVAVYFSQRVKSKWSASSIACDKWDRVQCNMHAIALTLGAIRALGRWGVSDIVERASAGLHLELDEAPVGWRAVFELRGNPTHDELRARFRELALQRHPDITHDDGAAMRRLNLALEQALAELGYTSKRTA